MDGWMDGWMDGMNAGEIKARFDIKAGLELSNDLPSSIQFSFHTDVPLLRASMFSRANTLVRI